MQKKYTFSDYDKHVALKPGLGFWLILIYFMRPFFLFISTIQMGRGMKNDNVSGLKDMVYPDDFSFFIGVLAALPVMLVIYAYINRKAGASDLVKKLWRNGRTILTIVGILNIVILLAVHVREADYQITTTDLVQLSIAIAIIIFLNTAQRIKDTFADFPSQEEEPTS